MDFESASPGYKYSGLYLPFCHMCCFIFLLILILRTQELQGPVDVRQPDSTSHPLNQGHVQTGPRGLDFISHLQPLHGESETSLILMINIIIGIG